MNMNIEGLKMIYTKIGNDINIGFYLNGKKYLYTESKDKDPLLTTTEISFETFEVVRGNSYKYVLEKEYSSKALKAENSKDITVLDLSLFSNYISYPIRFIIEFCRSKILLENEGYKNLLISFLLSPHSILNIRESDEIHLDSIFYQDFDYTFYEVSADKDIDNLISIVETEITSWDTNKILEYCTSINNPKNSNIHYILPLVVRVLLNSGNLGLIKLNSNLFLGLLVLFINNPLAYAKNYLYDSSISFNNIKTTINLILTNLEGLLSPKDWYKCTKKGFSNNNDIVRNIIQSIPATFNIQDAKDAKDALMLYYSLRNVCAYETTSVLSNLYKLVEGWADNLLQQQILNKICKLVPQHKKNIKFLFELPISKQSTLTKYLKRLGITEELLYCLHIFKYNLSKGDILNALHESKLEDVIKVCTEDMFTAKFVKTLVDYHPRYIDHIPSNKQTRYSFIVGVSEGYTKNLSLTQLDYNQLSEEIHKNDLEFSINLIRLFKSLPEQILKALLHRNCMLALHITPINLNQDFKQINFDESNFAEYYDFIMEQYTFKLKNIEQAIENVFSKKVLNKLKGEWF